MAPKKSAPSWSDVKAKLADFDRAGLLGLVQDLYAAGKDNQAFLHARFALGDDVPRIPGRLFCIRRQKSALVRRQPEPVPDRP